MIRFGVRTHLILFSVIAGTSLAAEPLIVPIQMLANSNPSKPSVFHNEADVKVELQKQFKEEVIKPLLEGLYKNELYPRGQDNLMAQRLYLPQKFAEPPINPPIPLPDHDCKDESQKNILEDPKLSECGKFSYVGFVNLRGIDDVGGGGWTRTFFSLPNNRGSCENSQLAGVLADAISEVEQEILTEIGANRINYDPNSGSAPAAKDLIDVLGKTKALQLDKLADCGKAQNTTEGRCSAFRYVDSIEKQTRFMLMNFLRARVMEKATVMYRSFVFNITNQIRAAALTPCETPCVSQADPNACLQQCYGRNFDRWIKNKAQSAFPLIHTACQGVR